MLGPPAGGKSTWVYEHCKPGDVAIDVDALADTLDPKTPRYHHPKHVDIVAKALVRAAIHTAMQLGAPGDVYVIHRELDPHTLSAYVRGGATVVVCDPGWRETMTRAQRERPALHQTVIREWYARHT